MGQGLLPAQNFQPIQGVSLQMPGESAVPLAKGELSLRAHVAETSTIVREITPPVTAVLKLNQLRSALDLRYGLPGNTEVGVEVASLYDHSGGIDGLITATENLFDRPAPTRQELKHMGYAFTVTRNRLTVLEPPHGAFGLADAAVRVKTLLLAERTYLPAIALRAAVKLPVGDRSRGFGTGTMDAGAGLALQKAFGSRVVLYVNVNEVIPSGHYAGLGRHSYFTSASGLELMLTPKFSITGQFDYYQSPFSNTGNSVLDHGVTELVGALGYRFTPRWLWQIYGVENLDFIKDSAADFTLASVLTYRLPPPVGRCC